MAQHQATKPFQAVFQLKLKRSPDDPLSPLPKPLVPRKAHTKSRRGCQSCKRRRVKCDELTPTCSRCAGLNQECVYGGLPSLTSKTSSLANSPQSTTPPLCPSTHGMTVKMLQTDLDHVLRAEAFSPSQNELEPVCVRVLQHFQAATSYTLGCATSSEVMQSHVAREAWNHPYLMHMILAISCAHQRHLGTVKSTSIEARYWQNGLQLHRQNLSTLQPGRCQESFDAIVAAIFLAVMYTFSLDELMTSGSEYDFAPMAAIGGFESLYWLFPGAFDPSSRWLPVLLSTDDKDGTFTNMRDGVSGLPVAFVDLCSLDDDSTAYNNPYHKIVRTLTPILRLQPDPGNFATLFACLGRCYGNLRPLLLRQDPIALLLLAYWLGTLRQVDQWWLTPRVKSKCAVIVAYLSGIGDPAITALLPFSAAAASPNANDLWKTLRMVAEDVI
ncbi:Sterol regulatory element-binding protein ECM22 [Pseudocercospora fuligena]|uniref:Sterol regulatory element-binding protein ECM22 n=1 Tax=Pseudocercospora fuligena TaxID=685502 RepID=A0A8H6RET1_9PEZI|nr:Sterol regulatory element-binding protein ECM22 [Pseudocercospora fuligena]